MKVLLPLFLVLHAFRSFELFQNALHAFLQSRIEFRNERLQLVIVQCYPERNGEGFVGLPKPRGLLAVHVIRHVGFREVPCQMRKHVALHRLRQVQPDASPVSIDMATILMLPGVCQPRQIDDEARHAQWQVVQQLAEQALDRLLAMRREEGQALRLDLLTQCQAIRDHLDVVARRAPSVIQEYHQRLARRVQELCAGATLELSKADLAREVAVFAERSDVNEELARLASHLDQFVQLCDSKEHAGRKLDFIAQEMLREANTIGSKANDGEIAREIVEVKSRIDRLKEQVQNVE